MNCSENYEKTFPNKIAAFIGGKMGFASRYSSLSPKEEKLRVELTLQSFDRRLWEAAFGGEDELKPYVAVVPKFVEARKDTVLFLFRTRCHSGLRLAARSSSSQNGR